MTTADEVARILEGEPQREQRILNFGALLARESGSEVVVVGGSAIEVYTRGRIVSDDIDIRAERSKIWKVLGEWGFRDHGKTWIRSDWKIAIDVVGDKYSGDPYRTRLVSTRYGPVRLAAVEDLIVKRLASAKHWQQPRDVGQAALLLELYTAEIDQTYLEQMARQYVVSDLLTEVQTKPKRRKQSSETSK